MIQADSEQGNQVVEHVLKLKFTENKNFTYIYPSRYFFLLRVIEVKLLVQHERSTNVQSTVHKCSSRIYTTW